jgi:uncharacterized protein YaaQ
MGLSYESLARLMSEAGCQINASALFKIEKGQPPRKITVDELVAFSKVFDTRVEDLLIPLELIDQDRARELLERLEAADTSLVNLTNEYLELWCTVLMLSDTRSDLYEYVTSHRFSKAPELGGFLKGGTATFTLRLPDDDAGRTRELLSEAGQSMLDYYSQLMITATNLTLVARGLEEVPEGWDGSDNG